MITIVVGVVCLVIGHLWGGTIWPWLRVKMGTYLDKTPKSPP